MIPLSRHEHYRRIFLSSWFAYVYDLWVWFAVLGRTRQLREKLVSFVPKHAKVAVDFATGSGEVALALKRSFPKLKVFGCDLSAGLLSVASRKSARRHLDVSFSVEDVANTSYPGRFADFVVVSFALHEIPRKVRVAVMREAFRILRKNGVFAVKEYHAPSNPFFWFLLLVQFFLVERVDAYSILREDLQGELRSVGFRRIVKQTYYGGSVQVVAGVK